MFGAISADLILEMAKRDGYMYQLPLFKTIPEYKIKIEYVCDVFSGYECTLDEYGSSSSALSHTGHPAFQALRNKLEAKGNIKVQRAWNNGDTVLEEFKLNDVTFKKGDRFLCAPAMLHTLTKGK